MSENFEKSLTSKQDVFLGFINESEMIAENARAMPEVDIQKSTEEGWKETKRLINESKEIPSKKPKYPGGIKPLKKSVDNLINTLEQGIEKGGPGSGRKRGKSFKGTFAEFVSPYEEPRIPKRKGEPRDSKWKRAEDLHALDEERKKHPASYTDERTPTPWEREINPTKERASLSIKKAILCLEGYTPMSDSDVMKSFHGTIPDIMKDTNSRPSSDWWNLAISKATFADDPVQYALSLWYSGVNKGVLGAGGGAAVGGALGGVPGAALGGMAGEAIESTVTGKSEKAEKACKPWTKKMVEEFVKQKGWALASEALKDPEATGRGIHEAGKGVREAAEGIAQIKTPFNKGVLGAGAGAAAGGALGGPVGAAIGGMAGETIEEKISPKKARKAMIKEKCMEIAKEIIKSENGVEDLSLISPEQFGRAGIQAMAETFNELGNDGIAEFGKFIQKAVAEPIGSKYSPQPRKGDDFGGESEVSGSGSHVNTADLKPSKKEISN